MKAVLEFTLPEDRSDHQLAIRAGDFFSALWDIDQYLRGQIKHGEMSEEVKEALQQVRNMIPHDLLNDID